MAADFVAQRALHLAVLPDGNGRWALARGLPRSEGHRAGVETVRRITAAAPGLGIGVLTIHALSCDNRRRPPDEVGSILECVRVFLEREAETCALAGVRVTTLGRRDRLPPDLSSAIEQAERATAAGTRLHLRLAIDYSARDAIRAVHSAGEALLDFGPDVDLLIRTGGEQRLSDFLLWECAYAELFFVGTPWPEFTAGELAAVVGAFQRRERRFGGPGVARADPPPFAPLRSATPVFWEEP